MFDSKDTAVDTARANWIEAVKAANAKLADLPDLPPKVADLPDLPPKAADLPDLPPKAAEDTLDAAQLAERLVGLKEAASFEVEVSADLPA